MGRPGTVRGWCPGSSGQDIVWWRPRGHEAHDTQDAEDWLPPLGSPPQAPAPGPLQEVVGATGALAEGGASGGGARAPLWVLLHEQA